jgi:hypothetical protein
MRREQPGSGVIDGIMAMFAPFTALSKQLQSIFQLERPPALRVEHGRLGILIRGTGVSDDPLADRIALAHQITEATRPLLRQYSKRERRRYADRAIAVSFEDEQVMETGIATSRFTYVALMPHDAQTDVSANRR